MTLQSTKRTYRNTETGDNARLYTSLDGNNMKFKLM